jgi:(R,R)-butanediol dehydrogenase/meso-butanediol dehydrogenase/diacetyl reductase
MRALRFHAAEDLRLEQLPVLEPGPGWARLRVAACGICGTDVEEFSHGPRMTPRPESPHPLTGESAPLTLGHEFAGAVEALGEGVEGLAIGDRVAVEPSIACGECPACLAGEINRCPRRGAVGLHGWGGGFADHVTLPVSMLHRLPDSISDQEGALVEPIAVGWHGLRVAEMREGQSVLVVGAGPVGLGALLAAKAIGASQVFVSVRRPGLRSETAADFGADAVLLGDDGPVPEQVMAATGGVGVDVAIEASGSDAGLDDALRSARIGGSAVVLGVPEGAAAVDTSLMLMRELRLLGSRGYAGEYPLVIAAMANGRIADPGRMVTATVPLEAAVQDGFRQLVENRAAHVKIIVEPGREAG